MSPGPMIHPSYGDVHHSGKSEYLLTERVVDGIPVRRYALPGYGTNAWDQPVNRDRVVGCTFRLGESRFALTDRAR